MMDLMGLLTGFMSQIADFFGMFWELGTVWISFSEYITKSLISIKLLVWNLLHKCNGFFWFVPIKKEKKKKN